ncbi:MAG: methionine--tRNA ligase [Anaerolineaceae bacterium]|jgi:methionyl-tRNA synthetase
MPETILIAIAWPYANSDIHVGNITGSHLPGDICARYHRLRGRKVLMVSGSDAHGTAITIKADQKGVSPMEVYQHYHPRFIELFTKLGISYDLFTSTHTANHFDIAQKIFIVLKENGYLITNISKQWYSTTQKRFLPDRYVEGTCYYCGNEDARSDQCEQCGHVLEAEKLVSPRSKLDGSTPELRETEHYYLDLSGLEPKIKTFLQERESYWRPLVINQSLGMINTTGLKPTPITRDLDWGIPVTLEGWEGKCLYVWFEAVMGYLSAAIEWCDLNGNRDAWRDWWLNPESKCFYYIGKDNITFHAVTWPAELLGIRDGLDRKLGSPDPKALVLPYNIPANEFMNLEGRKISGSQNWAVWGLDALERYDPDALRYYLTVAMPETRDTDWDWEDFFQRNNNELVATWGNLVNRVLSFTYKHWEGIIPAPEKLRESDLILLQTIGGGFEKVGQLLEKVELRGALAEAMALATEVNKYLDMHGPWFEIKTDRKEAEKTIYTAIQAIAWLSVMLSPFLPFTSQAVHEILDLGEPLFQEPQVEEVQDELGSHQILLTRRTESDSERSDRWLPNKLVPGRKFKQPYPLFKKLDHKIVEEERDRLGAKS